MRRKKREANLIELANIRKQLGFTQELMAAYLGVTRSTVKMAESGDRSLPTAALIKFANMEIQMAAEGVEYKNEAMHPAEHSGEQFKDDYEQFFSSGIKCSYLKLRLVEQLEDYIKEYRIIRNKLRLIETAIIENYNNPVTSENWKRQYDLAIKVLHKCGLPVQAVLKSRIHFLDTQATLYKKLQEQIRKELPGLLK